MDAVIDDFLTGYYGPAAPYLRRYIDITHRTLRRSGARLDIYKGPREAADSYLTPRLMDRYERLFDRAADAVADDPVLSRRIREARLPLEYARLEQAGLYGTGKRGFFERDPAAGTGEASPWRVRPAMRRLLDAFVAGCEAAGVTRLDEHGMPPDEYRERLERLFSVSMQDHLALFRPVEVLTVWSPTYPANGTATFTDGLKGVEDWTYNWLGFEGHDMTVVVDLESERTVREIATDFLQGIHAWIWLPLEVCYAVSTDGENWREVAHLENTVPETRAGDFIETFAASFEPVAARYVKVEAVNRKECPGWHTGHGGASWISADEIIVK